MAMRVWYGALVRCMDMAPPEQRDCVTKVSVITLMKLLLTY